MSLSGCDSPPVVSGDLSCERFRHISATDSQRAHAVANYDLLESWLRQIVAHNDEYDKDCLSPPAADPKGKSK